ncbi:MarR family winged helix-turn-helix transcriptional regulator [Roseococcus thiosulfatophilus]|uniref:MarR family winged helix-turn-helix transcriptional regulator n=1 Tax=Roseococcus thiosulfatophilus TaxID=35813 RepID=UPI0038D0504C
MPDRPPSLHQDVMRPDSAPARSLLFLREEELRLAQDLLYFGYRDFTAGADRILAQLDMGRAHHRVLHFVGRAPGMKVGELLAILSITKQSLGRVLQPLIDQGYVHQAPGLKDKRQRLLRLTPQGEALERRLFDAQREWVLRAYREAGPEAVEGFRRVMRGLMGPEARTQFEALERAAAPGRTTPAFAPMPARRSA